MLKRIATALLLAVSVLPVAAQNIPSFPKDPGILYGALPNGIVYYICHAEDPKGKFDCAVVRRDSTFNATLRSADFFSEPPYLSLAKMGAEALAPVVPDAYCCLLTDVPAAAMDSTLLLVTAALSSSNGPQAVIVAGDIDSRLALDHLRTMTMLLPARASTDTSDASVPEVQIRKEQGNVEAVFLLDRTPRQYMGGAIPYVNSSLSLSFLELVQNRLRAVLRERDIPYAGLHCVFLDNTLTSGKQKIGISLYSPEREKAQKALDDIISSIRSGETGPKEFEAASFASDFFRKREDLSNYGRLCKCRNAYIYGSDLATAETVNGFFITHKLDPEKSLSIFNRFSSRLVGEGDSLFRFSREPADLDTLMRMSAPKQKLRLTSADPSTGGSFLRFQNGIKVFHKQCGNSGTVEFAAIMRGGRSQIAGTNPAESEFAADMLRLGKIAGIDAQDFLDALRGLGISLEPEITDADFRISGKAPADRLELALRAMSAMLTGHECASAEELDYFRRCRMLEISPEHLLLADSLSRPEYRFNLHADASAITDRLPVLAEDFFRKSAASMNEGLLIVTGDVDGTNLEKILSQVAGLLPTSRVRAVRPMMDYREASGTMLKISETGEPLVHIQYSADTPVNAEKAFSLKVTGELVLRKLRSCVAPLGYSVTVDSRLECFPVDRMVLSLTLVPVRNGLPESVVPAEPMDVLTAVVDRMNTIMSGSPAGFQDALRVVEAETENAMRDPECLLRLGLERYSSGKDFSIKYKETLKYLNDNSIKNVLSVLKDGAVVMYVSL